ncbi:hypothetical protein MLD38_039027 [Melastoma candidum]|uniref:Uncharacterized protein n=1 Tax=Melastoma candidum TaxID=119954 RepID=A0ACB9L126_9MYRT|nr:hypothetical protein MLD38_039027 [Melastoma candidum]
MPPTTSSPSSLPLVVTLNCIDDPTLEQTLLSHVATVSHVPLTHLTTSSSLLSSASAVLIHSLSYLPRAAQRRLHPNHLILCLGSPDRSLDSSLASDLGLQNLVHVDVSRDEEVADTVMALVLSLLRKTHLLSRNGSGSSAGLGLGSGWLGAVQGGVCKGMRRCRGLVVGIVGRSKSAKALANRILAFQMSVLYFDVLDENGKVTRSSISFPPSARRMDTLNDLLAASDVISLHCALTNETVHILNAECLQHVKPGAFLVNTGSSQLLDDCAVKQLLIDGSLGGCALDGVEGPQWMEAWVREMPNVLILPRSADYSEEVWMEIREKAVAILQSYFYDGIIPKDAISDEEVENSAMSNQNEQLTNQERQIVPLISEITQTTSDNQPGRERSHTLGGNPAKESPSHHMGSGTSQEALMRSDGRRSRSGKKAKKRHGRHKSGQKFGDPSALGKESTLNHEDDAAMSGTDQVLSSSSRFASPEDSRSRKVPLESLQDSTLSQLKRSVKKLPEVPGELLRDGYVVALYAKDHPTLHVSRQRVKGGGWFLDTMSNVTNRDPAAQFLVVLRSKDTIGLRSFAAGGKLLQINRRVEFVFASHSFDVWESWTVEGSLDECRLVNCRNTQAVLEVRIEILAAVSEEDGITRWLE